MHWIGIGVQGTYFGGFMDDGGLGGHGVGYPLSHEVRCYMGLLMFVGCGWRVGSGWIGGDRSGL